MKHTAKSTLLSTAALLALAVPAALGALHTQNRPPSEGQAQTAVETVKLHPLVGTPQELEAVADATPPAETAATTAAPEYILPDFEAYDFIPLSTDLQTAIYIICADYEIAYDLILAVIKTESEFDTAAIGDYGHAYGLMQIQPCWWDKLAADKGLPDYRTDAEQNAKLGIAILSLLLTENGGDLNKALIAYNGGADYPERVYANYAWIRRQKGESE